MVTLDRSIQRYPVRPPGHGRELLQAWDSADELILGHLSGLELAGQRILIVNDAFGAISSALTEGEVTTYSDSFVSTQAIRLNSQGRIQPIPDLNALSGIYDTVVIRIPKNNAFFEDILSHVSQHIAPGTLIVCGAMVKYLSSTAFELLERIIGPTHTSLAQKKARLVFGRFEKAPTPSPHPTQVKIEGVTRALTYHSNLFSREKLDIGTRFLLSHIPQGEFKTILDLGCGNGLIGIAASRSNPGATIILSDDSWMAVESAKANFERECPGRPFHALWMHSYENQARESVDLVLCNPPFHQGGGLNDALARQMFLDAKAALVPGGMIRVIGNTHLGYARTLERLFGNSQVVAANAKFTIADAIRA